MTDELRDQLRRLDPMRPEVSTDPITSPTARALLEDIMSTPVTNSPADANTTVGATDPTPRRTFTRQNSTRWWALGAAAAAIALVAGGALLVGGGDDGNEQVASGPPLELDLGEQDVMAMCLAFDTAILGQAPVAFEGTVSSVDGDVVTLDVDRWFTGGDAAQVTLHAPQGMEALIDGIAFEVGGQYLISATDGSVNYCGYSSVSTPEMRAAFEQAFAA